jgi:hypothetical protein
MSNFKRRLEKIEKKLHIGKPHLVNFGGMVMTSDEFVELLEKIDGTSKGVLPSKDELLQVEAWEKEGML